MLAEKLNIGDTIGLISPSHVANRAAYAAIIAHMEKLGFKVKTGANLYKDTWGSVASDTERADDLNAMVADSDVKLIFFGGGNGAADILPLIDYENIKKHPKLFLSYSDGTLILNAIYTQTGLVTYYGQTPGVY
ncbi:MAG: LD-carboxypeptidase, partial [Clostridia bacterium]|nr:LD-carboxypeptidase [Clostridia bacterium]